MAPVLIIKLQVRGATQSKSVFLFFDLSARGRR